MMSARRTAQILAILTPVLFVATIIFMLLGIWLPSEKCWGTAAVLGFSSLIISLGWIISQEWADHQTKV